MEFLEKTLEDIIWENAKNPDGRELLKRRGLEIRGSMFRQLELGGYGRTDLVTVEYIPKIDEVVIVIYELKKGIINVNALMQAARYVKALRRHGMNNEECGLYFHISICLIGDSIDQTGDFVFLYNELIDVDIYTYDFRLTGLYFNLQGKDWGCNDENLNEYTKNLLKESLIRQIEKAKDDDTDK